MRLSASLLALVAAVVPAVVSASSPGSPGGYNAAFRVHWVRVLFGAIKEHIGLAALTVNFIAKNFENPPHPDSDRIRAANPEFKILAPGYFHFVDHGSGLFRFANGEDPSAKVEMFIRGEWALDDELAAVESLLRLDSLVSSNNAGKIIKVDVQRPLHFDMENFETDGNVHVLRDGAQARAELLREFYIGIRDEVLSEVPASDDVGEHYQGIVHRLPRVPDIFRSADSGGWNLQAQFTNEDVRELLLSVADELSRCLSELYDAQSVVRFPRDIADWLDRLESLEDAISAIRIYNNDLLVAHNSEIGKLFEKVKIGDVDESYRFFKLTIARAADAARAMYCTDD